MAAMSTFGSTLKMGTTTAGAYTAPTNSIGEVTSLNLDGLQLNTIDVTTISDRFRKFIPGIIDSGTITLDVNVDPDDTNGQVIIMDLLDVTANSTAPVSKSFLLEYGAASGNPGCKFECVGIVTQASFKGAIDSALTASLTIKLTGSLNFVDVD
jgi:hypothetical protein